MRIMNFLFHIYHDVAKGDGTEIGRKRYYTILMQLGEGSTDEYSGGELWVNNIDYEGNSVSILKLNQQIGTVCIFGNAQLHWVTPITSGNRWSCTIFLEKDALKKTASC